MRRHPRLDANHSQIVSVLRQCGCSVQSLAAIGKGCPDLLVARNGLNYLLEIKDGTKPPSARALTEDEVKFRASWNAPVYVVESVDAALLAVGAISNKS